MKTYEEMWWREQVRFRKGETMVRIGQVIDGVFEVPRGVEQRLF